MELLVRVVDRGPRNDDPTIDCKLTVAGDVIVYKPDGLDWGLEEIKNPEYRIIHVPDMSEELAQSLVAEEIPTNAKVPSKVLQRRGMRLDIVQLDALEAGKILIDKAIKSSVVDQLKDDGEKDRKTNKEVQDGIKQLAVDAVVGSANVLSVLELKPPLSDPMSPIGVGDRPVGIPGGVT